MRLKKGLFVLLQRYTFWRNSQLALMQPQFSRRCLYYCKDTLFDAIHNLPAYPMWLPFVVCITAKIHFLTQFTTDIAKQNLDNLLFVLLQRYTFWRNSQPMRRVLSRHLVVCITAKIHFLTQFTTNENFKNFSYQLFVLLQRYTFWRNSQQKRISDQHEACCLYYCKDTLFDAIHNTSVENFPNELVVCITAKIHFLTQFTTFCGYHHQCCSCLYYCKDTLFDAIHNDSYFPTREVNVVCITAKIHFLTQFTTLEHCR